MHRFLILLLVVFCAVFITSSSDFRQQEISPQYAFAHIKNSVSFTPHVVVCEKNHSKEMCDILRTSIRPVNFSKTGSGAWIKTNKGIVVLTAGHVCDSTSQEPSVPEYLEYRGVKVRIIPETKITIQTKFKTTEAQIIKIDSSADLCLLSPKAVIVEGKNALKVSDEPPKLYSKVTNYAAPHGLFGAEMLLKFSGYFSGIANNNYFFSVPCKSGSSGSVILNDKNEVISVVHSAVKTLENVCLGVQHRTLTNFLL